MNGYADAAAVAGHQLPHTRAVNQVLGYYARKQCDLIDLTLAIHKRIIRVVKAAYAALSQKAVQQDDRHVDAPAVSNKRVPGIPKAVELSGLSRASLTLRLCLTLAPLHISCPCGLLA